MINPANKKLFDCNVTCRTGGGILVKRAGSKRNHKNPGGQRFTVYILFSNYKISAKEQKLSERKLQIFREQSPRVTG
jgi:hypothetical protein